MGEVSSDDRYVLCYGLKYIRFCDTFGMIFFINKPVVELVESRRAVEMLCGSE